MNHIQMTICRGHPEWYIFFMGYFAHMIQRPNEVPGTAIVLLGDKGTGKSIVFEEVIARNIIPDNSLVTRDIPMGFETVELVGKHLCVLTEPQFGEDASVDYATIFKHRITSAHQAIHEQGRNDKVIRNRVRYVATSSSYFTGYADVPSRRFFVLRCDNTRVGDLRFFSKMLEQLENGGYELFHQILRNWSEPEGGWTNYLNHPPLTPWNDTTNKSG
jgi:hypothetical protein